MRDWPNVSLRSRVFEVLTVGSTLLQASIVVTSQPGGPAPFIANVIGILVLLLCLGIAMWALRQLSQRTTLPTWALTAMVLGQGLRMAGRLPVSYLAPNPPVEIPGAAFLWMLGIGYALLFAGYGTTAIWYGRGVPLRRNVLVAALAAIGVAVFFLFAAFGPLPEMPTLPTVRDHFAMLLLAGDLLVMSAAVFITLAHVQRTGSALVHGWVWLAVGELVVAMGDTVSPLLTLTDAPKFAPLLWGLGYALIASGTSILVDVFEWQAERGIRSPFAIQKAPASASD